MYICIANITLSSSSTSSHLFDIILDYDVLQAWTCPQCPLPLSPNEHERLYDGINEVHIADGINMGTTAALKELETWNMRSTRGETMTRMTMMRKVATSTTTSALQSAVASPTSHVVIRLQKGLLQCARESLRLWL